jgi:hypothetical protein
MKEFFVFFKNCETKHDFFRLLLYKDQVKKGGTHEKQPTHIALRRVYRSFSRCGAPFRAEKLYAQGKNGAYRFFRYVKNKFRDFLRSGRRPRNFDMQKNNYGRNATT